MCEGLKVVIGLKWDHRSVHYERGSRMSRAGRSLARMAVPDWLSVCVADWAAVCGLTGTDRCAAMQYLFSPCLPAMVSQPAQREQGEYVRLWEFAQGWGQWNFYSVNSESKLKLQFNDFSINWIWEAFYNNCFFVFFHFGIQNQFLNRLNWNWVGPKPNTNCCPINCDNR